MKKPYIFPGLVAFITFLTAVSYAAPVGNPLDIDVPERSAFLREQVIDETLDEYEQPVQIKTSLDIEFLIDKELDTSSELSGAQLEGKYYMVKIGATILNKVEPYVKLGLSSLEAKWKHGNDEYSAESNLGFTWGAGLKGIIWEFENIGLRLTGDAQYRSADLDVDECALGGRTVTDPGATFKVDEWQIAFLLSKKFEIPLKLQSIYVVPYTGVKLSDSKVDVNFKDPTNPTADNSLYFAGNDKKYGFVAGCDIVPSLTGSYMYSIELRLVDETSISLGGAVKF